PSDSTKPGRVLSTCHHSPRATKLDISMASQDNRFPARHQLNQRQLPIADGPDRRSAPLRRKKTPIAQRAELPGIITWVNPATATDTVKEPSLRWGSGGVATY